MKLYLVIVLSFLCCFLASCSHIHTISMTASAAPGHAPKSVDLAPFWREHGFTLVEPDSEFGKMRYSSEDGSKVVAVWEKWFKGIVFKYSGGMWATEALRGDRYEITFLPVSSSRDADTQEMAHLLKDYLHKNYPDAQSSTLSQSFMDLR